MASTPEGRLVVRAVSTRLLLRTRQFICYAHCLGGGGEGARKRNGLQTLEWTRQHQEILF